MVVVCASPPLSVHAVPANGPSAVPDMPNGSSVAALVPPSSMNSWAPSQYCRKSSDSSRHPSSTVWSTLSQNGGVVTGL